MSEKTDLCDATWSNFFFAETSALKVTPKDTNIGQTIFHAFLSFQNMRVIHLLSKTNDFKIKIYHQNMFSYKCV